MKQLRDALGRASAGRGGLFAIVGEAGIGKSRLVEELIAHARAAGRASPPRQGVRE